MTFKPFDEKFKSEIEQMKTYLATQNLRSIGLGFTDGWKFRLGISKKEWEKNH